MRILFIVGRKKAGKTTLIEKLLSGLKEKGYKLGSIKHTSHDHQFDREGTDSFRHARAGAETTLILSPHKAALFSESMRKRDLDQLFDFLFKDCDLIIGEGFKGSPFPKIEVLGTDAAITPICGLQDKLVAVVGAGTTGLPVAHFKMDQLEEIIKFVEEKFLKEDADKESH
jgi:molybdopterin-guanine dinucleotide biosynthesis protein B